MIEQREQGELAVLVHFEFLDVHYHNDLAEFELLAKTAGAQVLTVFSGSKSVPEVKFFIGVGKVAELAAVVASLQAELVIFNHDLSPSQNRNLEKELNCRVIDRTELILDIFASRARTYEGKLQVELAQLQRLSTRLIRGWTHLERQKGGIGLRGPGETQLETDRRLIRERIKKLTARLQDVKAHRNLSRQARQKSMLPTLSLVGYTNAGKSTLFNLLTNADVFAEDLLFATLDPTLRKMKIPGVGPVVLVDTVGFISHLPHKLIESFHATLEETEAATLLLHVVDVSHERKTQHIQDVESVLNEIDASHVPTLMVMNKIDKLEGFLPRIERNESGKIIAVWISAHKNLGISLLLEAIKENLSLDFVDGQLYLAPELGKLRAELLSLGVVQHEALDSNGAWVMDLRIPKQAQTLLWAQYHISPSDWHEKRS